MKTYTRESLIGVTPVKYSGDRDRSEIAASLGPACHEIRQAMKLQGLLSENQEYDQEGKETYFENSLGTI